MTTEICAHTSAAIEGEIFCMEALCPDRNIVDTHPLEVYKATADPDTMYHHQAMREHDRMQFLQAMKKEVHDQMKNGNFSIVKHSQVPKDKPALWLHMLSKRCRFKIVSFRFTLIKLFQTKSVNANSHVRETNVNVISYCLLRVCPTTL